MLPETLEQIKQWKIAKPRDSEERYPKWVSWLKEWQEEYKQLKQCSFVDFMEWKAENHPGQKN